MVFAAMVLRASLHMESRTYKLVNLFSNPSPVEIFRNLIIADMGTDAISSMKAGPNPADYSKILNNTLKS